MQTDNTLKKLGVMSKLKSSKYAGAFSLDGLIPVEIL